MNLSRTAEQWWVLGQVKLDTLDEISQTAAAELRHAEVIQGGQGVGLPHMGSRLMESPRWVSAQGGKSHQSTDFVAIMQRQTAMSPSCSPPTKVGIQPGSR